MAKPKYRSRVKELRHVKASALLDNPRNWRKHPAVQRDALKGMLERIGLVNAVIARETDEGLVLIDGHLRKDIASTTEIPVLIVDLNEDEALEALVTLDPLAGLATPDDDMIDSLIQDLAAQGDKELNALLQDVHQDRDLQGEPSLDGTEDDIPETPDDPISKTGDVWLLGKHRLMCGDSTSADDVRLLLDGNEPRLMVTDPPYGVNYDPSWRDGMDNLANSGGGRGLLIADTRHDWLDAYTLFPGNIAYVWIASWHFAPTITAFESIGFDMRAMIVWVKNSGMVSRGHYNWRHEPAIYAVRKKQTAHWIGDHKQATVWEIPVVRAGTGDATGHSTQKPLECMERPIKNHEGDVYDPFVGSGTIIIAAERQGRSCYAMEISPAFVDVCVKRWEQYTGEKAVNV